MTKRGDERPNTRAATASPTFADLKWAAGFLEGEGVFGYSGQSETVRAHQTESPEPLVELLRLFGGTIRPVSRADERARGRNARDSQEWAVAGARARGVMMTLYRLLSPKRQRQIRIALSHRKQWENAGDHHHKTKLSLVTVNRIRLQYNAGVSVGDLVHEYRVHRSTIYRVAHFKRWAPHQYGSPSMALRRAEEETAV